MAEDEAARTEDFVHYIEVLRENGSIVRHCRATTDCPMRHICFLKRIQMEKHLRNDHKIPIDIPKRRVGRPIGPCKRPLSESSRSIHQSKTRFSDMNFRVDNAKNRKMKYTDSKAYSKWEALDNKDEIPFEEWRELFMKEEMDKWEKKMQSRKKRMIATITRGYNASKRRCVKTQKKTKNDTSNKEMPKTPTSDAIIVYTSPLAPCKAPRSYDLSPSIRIGSARSCRQPKFKNKELLPVSIDILSPTDTLKDMDINVLVSTNMFECQGHPSISSLDYMDSLKNGMVYHLRSQRYGLDVDFDENLMNGFTNTKASTKMLNLFTLWMEFTMPSKIMEHVWFIDSLWYSFMFDMPENQSIANFFGAMDLSTCLFTCFPIIESSHWTLAVFYNGHMRRLPGLPRGRSAILFFDSLGVNAYKNYLPRIHMVLQHFAQHTSRELLKMELMNVSLLCDIYSMESPLQPNGDDCGYYVMACMYFLIMGGLLHKRSKKWLTKAWFSHNEVECLKQEMKKWVQSCFLGCFSTR